MAGSLWEGVDQWQELMSSDPDGAERFYGEVIGLTTSVLQGGPFPYTVWLRDGNPIGGLIPPQGADGWPSGKTPHWITSFAVVDVDKAVGATERLGGEVLVPATDIPNFGEAAVLKDPEGAVFGVFRRD